MRSSVWNLILVPFLYVMAGAAGKYIYPGRNGGHGLRCWQLFEIGGSCHTCDCMDRRHTTTNMHPCPLGLHLLLPPTQQCRAHTRSTHADARRMLDARTLDARRTHARRSTHARTHARTHAHTLYACTLYACTLYACTLCTLLSAHSTHAREHTLRTRARSTHDPIYASTHRLAPVKSHSMSVHVQVYKTAIHFQH